MKSVLLLFIVVLIGSCKKPPQLPPEPKILDVGFDKMQITAGEELVVGIDFEDGDGDLGEEDTSSASNAYLIDSRYGFTYPYKIPVLNTSGVPQAISGTVWIKHPMSCDPVPPNRTLDTVSFEVYVVDRAGNESNHFQTEEVIIECQ